MKNLKYNCIRLIFLAFLAYSHILTGQEKIGVKDRTIICSNQILFQTYKGVDSIAILFRHERPFYARIYKTTDPISPTTNIHEQSPAYDLTFEGDRYMLSKEFPLINDVVSYTERKKGEIQEIGEAKSFRLVLSRKGISYFPWDGHVGYRSPVADIHPKRLVKFMDYLNRHYSDSIFLSTDSTLIIQTIVETDGSLLEETALVYGEKDGLYDYFFKSYANFLKNEIFPEKLFTPYRMGGVATRGLLDIYVRLNHDNTFTVSGRGEARKMVIKNYRKDPDIPLSLF